MSIPTAYSETSFAGFLHKKAGRMADYWGWTWYAAQNGAGDYQEMVDDALTLVGLRTVGEATTLEAVSKLRAAGEVALWRTVTNAFTIDYDFSADGGSYQRSQMHKQAADNLAQAQAVLAQLDWNGGTAWTADAQPVTRGDWYDPQQW